MKTQNIELSDALFILKSNEDMSAKRLEELIPKLGLNNEILHEQPTELSCFFGKGLKMWQYPNQLAKFGEYISKLNVKSYLEIGCRWGGTFIFVNEILRKSNLELKSYACDIIPMSSLLKDYQQTNNFVYYNMSSQSEEFKYISNNINPELVFIDGDHSYIGVKKDFELFKDNLNTNFFVFHDIVNDACPGVVKFWSEIKNMNGFTSFEFTDQYASVRGSYLGIGVLVRNNEN